MDSVTHAPLTFAHSHFLPNSLFDSPSSSVLLTENALQAQSFCAVYDGQKQQQHTSWQTPPIYGWLHWVEQTWQSLDNPSFLVAADSQQEPLSKPLDPLPCVLDRWQERLLWQEIITNDAHSNTQKGIHSGIHTHSHVADLYQLSEMAIRSWAVLHEQNKLDVFLSETNATNPWVDVEENTFRRWALQFQQRLKADGWITRVALPQALTNQLKWQSHERTLRLSAVLPKQMWLCFARNTPQQDQLRHTLSLCKVEVHTQQSMLPVLLPQQLPSNEFSCSELPCSDLTQEMEALARWVAHRWQAAASIQSLPPRLAIVLADEDTITQAAIYKQLQRILPLLDVDIPPEQRSCLLHQPSQPLHNHPLIALGITLLRLQPTTVPIRTLCQLLSSTHLHGAKQEHNNRKRVELKLLDIRRFDWPFEMLIDEFKKARLLACPQFLHTLQSWHQIRLDWPQRAKPIEWIVRIHAVLKCWGWGKERGLDETTQHVLAQWERICDQCCALGAVADELSWDSMIETIEAMCAQQRFHSITENNHPHAVQVLDINQALGQRFDGIWLVSFTPDHSPPSLSHKLLFSQEWKTRLSADISTQWQCYQHDLKQLLTTTPQVVVSHRSTDTASLTQAGAPMGNLSLTNLTLTSWKELKLDQISKRLSPPSEWEWHNDPALPVISDREVMGTSNLLKEQAECSFKAFAHHRLHATSPSLPFPLPGPAELGQFLHAALENFWKKTENQQQLHTTSPEQQQADIDTALNHAADKILSQSSPISHSKVLKQLLKDEGVNIFTRWLEAEKARNVAFKVKETEIAIQLSLGGLTFRLRIDRIDQLEDGREVVIDYKTGKGSHTTGDWIGERPKDPQLMLYAIAQKQAPAGILYGNVNPKEGGENWDGLVDEEDLLGGKHPKLSVKKFNEKQDSSEPSPEEPSPQNIAEWCVRWNSVLEGLASSFVQGNVVLNPKKGACTSCDIKPLCRISELSRVE